ncbi:proprotein convertase P-domain-containing protein [uncultured Dokdonia sp.]|uniref:proprotein convertase P-domain-containing protein n=1 Tax=uncultured Dokdonia sp. TaxID=575653 RepID=UPI0026150C9E|nr:proprotein convertase P-domain-containing protein [uncultured Dokdonia sp.]
MKKITLPLTILFLVFGALSNAQTVPGVCDAGTLLAQETSTPLPLELDGEDDITIDCENEPNIIAFDIAETGIIGSTTSLSQVVFEIEHTYSGDLEIALVSPAGTSIVLTDNNSGNTVDAYFVTTFGDGGEDITTATPPYTGSIFQPQGGNFADVFDGESITGTWQLRICDTTDLDTGAVAFAGIVFCNPIPPSNDLIENAIDVDEAGFPFTDAAVNFLTATGDVIPNDTNCGTGGNPVPAVWYKFTATEEGTATATITTPASDASSALVVFYNAPDENATVGDLLFEDSGTNECASFITSSIETVPGQTYYLLVINLDTASDVVIEFDNNLSIDEQAFDGFEYFPNPVQNTLTLNAQTPIEKISLYTLSGQKVIEQTNTTTTTQLDMTALSSGIYLMKTTINGQEGTFKILKQ